MDTIIVVLGIFCVVLIIGIVILIAMNVNLSMGRINPANCPSALGEFNIIPNSSYVLTDGSIAILNKCGLSGFEPCQTNADNIGRAIEYCNSNITNCNTFIYSISTRQVAIIDTATEPTLVSNPNQDVFIRQNSIII